MDLKLPITIHDETSEDVIVSKGLLDMASGEIQQLEFEDYDVEAEGQPVRRKDYEFSSGILAKGGKEVEFRIDVDRMSGKYSVSPSELLEIKKRAAALFTAPPGPR